MEDIKVFDHCSRDREGRSGWKWEKCILAPLKSYMLWAFSERRGGRGGEEHEHEEFHFAPQDFSCESLTTGDKEGVVGEA